MVKAVKAAPKLPVQQLTILAICRFAEPVAMTSVYPYIPEMIRSFDVPSDQVAKWAGLLSATFSLSQCLTGMLWGTASDSAGRKPMILIALTATMISSVMFGFSRSLLWAFLCRILQGLSNGNVGIIRTAVAELVPHKELQPRAFSVMPLVWTVGSIFGPAFGGTLVYPVKRFPAIFKGNKLLAEFPFALPNILISVLFMLGIMIGFLFFRETLEDRKDRPDVGLFLGSLLTRSCTKRKIPRHRRQDSLEDEPFLSGVDSEMSTPMMKAPLKPKPKPPGWGDVFSRQSNINLAVYTLLAMHSVAYDQLLPIFMNYEVQSSHDPRVRLPLRFTGGFGMNSASIGFLSTFYGIFGMFVQFFVFPPMARKYGALRCLKACAIVFPFTYMATPFTALLPTNHLRQGVCFAIMLVKCFFGIFSFPCSTILLTNSASSLKILGTLNGVATSISALGRAAGPALAGATFTLGVHKGYIITPFWTLAGIAVIAAIPVFFLEEMEGFGPPADSTEDSDLGSDEEGEEDIKPVAATTAMTDSLTKRGGGSPPVVVVGDGTIEEPDDVDEDMPFLGQLDTNTSRSSMQRHLSPQQSRTEEKERRQSSTLRRAPSPIGMGRLGVARPGIKRYSSDLGTTMSGFGTGGTNLGG